MKIWLLVLIVLTGCSSTPQEMPITFGDFEKVDESATYPDPLPKMNLGLFNCGSNVCIDPDATSRIERYSIIAEGNTELATANAKALEATNKKANSFIDAGISMEYLIQLREEQLENERREHQQDLWYHRGIIGLFLIAAGVASSN